MTESVLPTVKYVCNRDASHVVRDGWMVTCPTCMALWGESSVSPIRSEPEPVSEFGRIDFTYWPETGEAEFHGHPPDDIEGDTPPLDLTDDLTDVRKALNALQSLIDVRQRTHDARRRARDDFDRRLHTGRC